MPDMAGAEAVPFSTLDNPEDAVKIFSMANKRSHRGKRNDPGERRGDPGSPRAGIRGEEGRLNRDDRRRLAESIIEGVEQIMRIRGMFFREELEKHGVTFPQFHLLKMVGLFGPITVTEASRLMLVAPPTASRMINGLCKKGLLERSGDPSDLRLTRIGLTPQGRAVLRKVNERQVSMILETLQEEDYEEVMTFASLLEKLVMRWGGDGAVKKADEERGHKGRLEPGR